MHATDAVKDYAKYGVVAHGVIKGEQAIMQQLVQAGPLACGICSKKLEQYSGGVWYGIGKSCSDHTITIAGYGSTDDGVPYWLVRNSWCVYICCPIWSPSGSPLM